MARVEPLNQEVLFGRLLKKRFGGQAMADVAGICSTPHLDDDSLSAFVEGRLSESEMSAQVSHLVECGGCRHASAELLRLSLEIDDLPVRQSIEQREPGKVKRFLEDLVARVLSRDESSVFAYHAPGEEAKPEEKKDEESEREN